MHIQDEDGFCCWEVIGDKNSKESLFIVANYLSPTEKVQVTDSSNNTRRMTRKGKAVLNKTIKLKDNKKLSAFYDFRNDDMQKCQFVEIPMQEEITGSITFNTLQPGEFKVYKMRKPE